MSLDTMLQRLPAVVRETAMVTPDIRRLDIESASGSPMPPADPGAHIHLWLPDGTARQYSVIDNLPRQSGYSIAVLREAQSRGGSRHVVDELQCGSAIQLSNPANHFSLVEDAEDYVLLAGGIGITPILPMLRRLVALGKPFRFHFFARTRDQLDLLDLIAGFSARPFAEAHIRADSPRFDLRSAIGVPRPDRTLFACGSQQLIDGVYQAAHDWPAGSIHIERFVAKAERDSPSGSFTIELAKARKSLTVPADQSVLQVLRQNGIRIESICREGVCGTCATRVIAGRVDHRDSLQSDEERALDDTMYVCVSRALSETIVLDL